MTAPTSRPSLLDDVRVVEICQGVPSAYCGRLLADLGADVVLVGDPSRPELRPDSDHSLSRGLWRTLHRNKRFMAPAPATAIEWGLLLDEADILIVEGRPEELEALGLPDPLPSQLVSVLISGFGQTGDLSGWRATDLIACAYGGGCNKNGEPGRPPLRPPAFVGDHEVGVNAAVAGLIALAAARQDGVGQHVDVSAVDSWATIQTGIGLLEFVFQGRLEVRLGRTFAGRGYPYTMLPCKDGEVRLICIQGREWARAIDMMGDPEWARDPRYANRLVNQERYSDELDELVTAWLAGLTMGEVLERALDHNVAWAPVKSLAEVLVDEQLAHRSFWWEADGLKVPGFPAQFSRTPARLRSEAPLEPEALAEPIVWQRRPPANRRERSDNGAPLAGIRVVDFGWAWAGAVPGAILADFGADVIKIESSDRLDPMRLDRPLVGNEQDREQGALHHNINRNKRSIEIDLRDPDDVSLVRRLIAESDVLVENLSTGSLSRFGLGYESLAQENPRLVYMSLAAVGRTGPLRDLRSYAPVLTGVTGVDAATGYAGERMLGLQHGFADPNAGLHAALAILAALHERETSGEGQYIDCSQTESIVSLLGGQLAAFQEGEDYGQPAGNRDVFMAPHGVYPAVGDDEWVAIACVDDACWRSLAELIDEPWALDPNLADLAGRQASADVLDERLAAWTAMRDKWTVASQLQGLGIPASPLLTSADRVADSHLASREAFAVVEHPVVGAELIYGVPWKFSRTPGTVRAPAPLLGEHSEQVVDEYLGVGSRQTQKGAIR